MKGGKGLYKDAVAVWKIADEKRKKKAGKKFTIIKPTPLPVPKVIPKLKLKDFIGESDVVNAGEDSGEDSGEDFGPSEGGSDEDGEDNEDND